MKILCMSVLALLVVAAQMPALADDVADERARLANQRIQIEEERRARDEAERQQRAAAEQTVASEDVGETAAPVVKDIASDVSVERMEMSRALEQLRELGALRDAGYVTEQEFEQLKKKILDAALL
ncbi:MAG: SHOCT domain-containing protein [Woeseiaceae bacterium]|nr:SHOCT domain-containing protein [Woeseiaceae bacterium]